MPTSYKILASAAQRVDADIYTAPAGSQVIVSGIVICNSSTIPVQAWLYIQKDGAGAAVLQAMLYGVTIASYESLIFTGPITLDAGDTIQVATTGGTVEALTWTVFGAEIT